MADYRKYSDTELTSRLREQDHAAFTEIYHRYHHFLLLYSRSLTKDADQSDDIVQDIFVSLWTNSDRVRVDTPLFNYLKGSVRKSFLKSERKKGTQSVFREYLRQYVSQGINTTDEQLMEKELAARLEKLAEKLPGKMGKVFLMTHFGNHSTAEIAKTLGVSEKTVKNLLSAAVYNIKVKLGLAIALFILLP